MIYAKQYVPSDWERYQTALYNCGWAIDVPDQELNPPEPRCPDYTDYVEHEQDRLIDEYKEITK
jgi:hypothetical protein